MWNLFVYKRNEEEEEEEEEGNVSDMTEIFHIECFQIENIKGKYMISKIYLFQFSKQILFVVKLS